MILNTTPKITGQLRTSGLRVSGMNVTGHRLSGSGNVIPRIENDYERLLNKPSINGVTLEGDLTSEDLHIESTGSGLPEGGQIGDILVRNGGPEIAEWVPPADDAEADNTRPITSAAVYREIGNIDALLRTI
jgi:hypothetical protein